MAYAAAQGFLSGLLSAFCRHLIDPDLPEDLRVTRAGQHFIVFVEMPDLVIVVDVLHSRSDLPRRLAAFGPPKDPEQH